MRKYIFLLVLPLIMGAFAVQPAYASNGAELKLQVLPFNCVFEYVNDGSNKILYMTPKECGLHLGQGDNPQAGGHENDLVPGLPVFQGGGDGVGFLDNLGPLEDTSADDLESLNPATPEPQPAASQNPWTKPLVVGVTAAVATTGVVVDAVFFGFSGAKLATSTAYNGMGLIRRLIRFLLKL